MITHGQPVCCPSATVVWYLKRFLTGISSGLLLRPGNLRRWIGTAVAAAAIDCAGTPPPLITDVESHRGNRLCGLG
jgi:hypothetical protein